LEITKMKIVMPIAWAVVTMAILATALPNGYSQQLPSPPLTTSKTMNYSIALHGGAGPYPKSNSSEAVESRRKALKTALQTGVEILSKGGAAIDAVEQVVLVLENDPQFNAGVGAVFNAAGGHELDASIMDGRDMSCGAVAGVSRVKNPISLARLVMRKTPHVLLIGEGAESFAREMQVEMVEPSYFDTERTRRAFEQLKAEANSHGNWRSNSRLEIHEIDTGSYHGTVGCVALDSAGNLAAATSTGGMTNKQFGRVGDSPIIGAGTYADNRTCAVSCTGIGEQFIRHAVAYDVAARLKYRGTSLQEAVREILISQLQRGDGGVIAIDSSGAITMQYNTPSMARAAADSTGRFEVFWSEETSR
jgi:beta-aspartyl-peptidase (threonine type)